ncbi:MAG: PTS sugar transporter subunit IIB [Erysipelotrichia bacterium]|nr:PTS sugar transporter subunit IIB [Erysipelotrichia bacterium]
MINIILCCQQGASTSMLAGSMREEAKKRGLEVQITAYPYTELNDVAPSADIVLFGPQVKYMLKEFAIQLDKINKPYMLIDTVDYGMMDGQAVLNKVLAKLK